MTTLAEFTEALRQAMAAHCRAADYDLEPDETTGALEVTTDDWTLSIEGVPDETIAFLAIDNEPEVESEYMQALHDVLRATERTALREANAALGGAIAVALDASGDPFSQHLAAELRLGS